MKTFFALYILGVFSLLTSNTFAQRSGTVPVNYGINGNLKPNFRLVGLWSPAGRHDCFKRSGTATSYLRLNAEENHGFGTELSERLYSVQDEYMLSDGSYASDYSDPPVLELTLILRPWNVHKKMALATRISGYPVSLVSHKFFSL